MRIAEVRRRRGGGASMVDRSGSVCCNVAQMD